MTLGELLKNTRKDKGLTAREMLAKTGLKASVSLVSQWENDQKIPIPMDLRTLCKFYPIDVDTAFHLWAAAHMPTQSLKEIFVAPKAKGTGKTEEREPIAYPSSITLVIREQDVDWFSERPVAATILARCLMAVNSSGKGLSSSQIAKGLGISKTETVKDLKELVERKYLVESGNTFGTPPGIKYLYLPETPPFEKMRRSRIRENLSRTLNSISTEMVFERKAFRQTVFKRIAPERVPYFVDSIEALAAQFISTGNANEKDSKYYQFICVLGPEEQHE